MTEQSNPAGYTTPDEGPATPATAVASPAAGAPDGSSPSVSDPVSEAVAPGYTFEGAALELGALMLNQTDLSDVLIRIPIAMPNRHGVIAGATGTGTTKTLQLLLRLTGP